MFTRRRLIQTTAAATTLAALRPLGSAHAAEAALKKVVIGVIGTGGRGTELAKQFAKQKNTEVAYVCDPDQNRVQKAASAVDSVAGKAPQAVADLRRVLDDKAVDAIVIAAPDHWHGPATILGCAANKHVYVEKPACHNPREGELMVEAARKYKRVVQLGTQRRSSPGLHEAVARLRDGAIGRVLLSRSQYFNPRERIGPRVATAVPTTLDYALWQGPAPETPYQEFPENKEHFHYHWHWFWHWGTAEVGNNGVHMIDVCRWGLGADYPTAVSCAGGRFRYKDSQETPDTTTVTIECGDQSIVWEQRSWTRKMPTDPGYEAAWFGENGSLAYSGGNYTLYDAMGKVVEEKKVGNVGDHHVDNFLSAVRDGTPLNQEIAEGVKSTLMCHLANIAYRTGRTVELDPKTHQLANDPEGMKLWSREYNPQWTPKV